MIRQPHSFRRLIIGSLLIAVGVTILVTVWSLWPTWRSYIIQRTLLEAGLPGFWWPLGWRREFQEQQFIKERLSDPVKLEFEETPLSDVCNFLSEFAGLKIQLGQTAMELRGDEDECLVSIHVEDIPLRSALRALLDPLDMAFLVDGQSLLFTTKAEARTKLETGVSSSILDLAVRQLAEADEYRRHEAAYFLGDCRTAPARAVPRLINALGADSREVRFAAAYALGELRPAAPSAIQSLANLVGQEKDGTVRWGALVAIKKIQAETESSSKDLLSILIEEVRRESRAARLAAIDLLRLYGSEAAEAVPVLIDLLADGDVSVARSAAGALSAISPEHVQPVLPALMDQLRQPDRATSMRAVEILRMIGPHGEPLVSDLIAMLDDPSVERWQAAKALGNIGPKAQAATPALLRALKDGDINTRWAAAFAFGQIGAPPNLSADGLILASQDQNSGVRLAAIHSMRKIGLDPERAVPVFAQSLHDEDEYVRIEAAIGLRSLSSHAHPATLALTEAMHDENAKVRRIAADALSRINPAAARAPTK